MIRDLVPRVATPRPLEPPRAVTLRRGARWPRAQAVLAHLFRHRRAAQRDALLAGALERVATGVRAGSSVTTALHEVARDCPEPLGMELRAVTSSVQHGAALGGALDAWATMDGASREVALAAAALSLGAEAGGQVARALDGVAATLRERREVAGEVRALATQARTSAGVLVLAPIGFTALVSTVEPDAAAFLFTSPVGLACLVVGVVLDGLGALWMRRIVRRASWT